MKSCLDAYLPEINVPFERLQKGIHTFITDQRKQLKSSLDFMLKVRNLLHAFADAPHEVLSYYPEDDDLMQLKIAQVLGYASSDA